MRKDHLRDYATNERLPLDTATRKWVRVHPCTCQITVVQCSDCKLWHMPYLRHKCKVKEETSKIKKYIPDNTVVLTAPAAGRTVYGAVTQLEEDKSFRTYAGKRIPKHTVDPDHDIRTLRLASRPLLIPNYKNSFLVADVG